MGNIFRRSVKNLSFHFSSLFRRFPVQITGERKFTLSTVPWIIKEKNHRKSKLLGLKNPITFHFAVVLLLLSSTRCWFCFIVYFCCLIVPNFFPIWHMSKWFHAEVKFAGIFGSLRNDVGMFKCSLNALFHLECNLYNLISVKLPTFLLELFSTFPRLVKHLWREIWRKNLWNYCLHLIFHLVKISFMNNCMQVTFYPWKHKLHVTQRSHKKS